MPSKTITWTTEQIKLGDLIEWEHNPVKLSDHDAEQIQISIEKFGLVLPLVANQPKTKRSVKRRLIDGHQRKTILVLSEIASLDTNLDVRIPSRKLTSRECDELSIRLRKNTGDFDFSILVDDFKVDDLLDWGFEEQELDLDLWGVEPEPDPGAQIDKAEELREKWGVNSGDLWVLGEHRLVCGDCTDAEVVDRVMDGEKAQMVFTDPPYGVDYDGGANNEIKRDAIIGDTKDNLRRVYGIAIQNAIEVTSPECPFYIFYASRNSRKTFEFVEDSGLEVRSVLIWNKINAHYGAFMSHYKMKYEPILYCSKKGKSIKFYGATNETAVWDIEQAHINEHHPTQKPIELAERAMANSSERDDIILDAFLGGGTTLIACERLKRKCRACEISPAYVGVTLQRYYDMTGNEPKLIK